MNVLLLGCGRNRQRKISVNGKKDFADDELVALDIDPLSNPDVLFDLNGLPTGNALPFKGCCFDEIHAYDVLEHIGTQGDWKGYFIEFEEYHRILKRGGLFFILVPIGPDAICDPGHSRFFSSNHFGFLNQRFYDQDSNVTDYRWYWKKNFEIDFLQNNEKHHIAVVLRKA